MIKHPIRLSTLVVYFLALFVVLSCTKDSDILADAILNEETTTVEDQNSDNSETEESEPEETAAEEEAEEESAEEPAMEDGFESRTTVFYPKHDAHVQSGKGYNQQIIRLDENNRTSYLMFNLEPIDSIGGYITSAKLQFTVHSDEGNGTINVYRALNSEWNEESIEDNTAPDIDILLGSIIKEYKIGSTEEVGLSSSDMVPENTTLILSHQDGNDLAIASKEHPTEDGPELIVTYNAPEEAGDIQEEPETIDSSASQPSNAAPVAIADASPSSGGVPLQVAFTGSNSTDDGSISSYSWDFKDGTTSNQANPSHTFTAIGSYEVALTVTDNEGESTTDTVTITVNAEANAAPVAVVVGNPIGGKAPLQVSFTGSNSTDDNSVASYSWDFKDGSTSSNANPTHTFVNPGTYNVTLTVTDENGLSDTKSIAIIVDTPDNDPPVAVASASPESGDAPLTVQFVGTGSTDDNAVTSYFWDFADDPSSAPNPVRTFNTPGVYVVNLTVRDAQGLSNTTSVTVTVNEASGGGSGGGSGGSGGGGSAPPGYYVTTNGSAFNNGLSEASSWSLEHAFEMARPGDIIYVKAGNYGNKELTSREAGQSGNPIKYVGYRNTPGDINSFQGSTYQEGSGLNSSEMPLLNSTSAMGTAFTVYDPYYEFENFQIQGYRTAVQSIGTARNLVLKNVIVKDVGSQSNSSAYDGFGFDIGGNNSLIENCAVVNATAEAIKLNDADYSRINYCSVYATNGTNPTDYYFNLSGGTNNAIVENSVAKRGQGLSHGGHGFNLKDLAENNIIRNCTAIQTSIDLSFSGVRYNTIENCSIYGVNTDSSQWHARLIIANGANNNNFRNLYIQDTWTAIFWADNDDGFVGQGGDRDEVSCGYDNTFENITVKNTNSVIRVGGGNNFTASAERNTFINSTFSDFRTVAVTYYPTEDIKFQNCTFNNGELLYVETGGVYEPYSTFDVSFINCNWNNVNFVPPN